MYLLSMKYNETKTMLHNYWFLRMLFLLPLIAAKENPCYHHHLHDNDDDFENILQIKDLIKTSPVILKALGARIFADITFDNKLSINKNSDNIDGDNDGDDNSSNNSFENIHSDNFKEEDINLIPQKPTMITLTPQTVYKGASILKSTSSRTMEGNSIDAGGEYYRYNGQLNATIKSIDCHNIRILRLLPIQLIVFGTLDEFHDVEGNRGGGGGGGGGGNGISNSISSSSTTTEHDLLKIVPGGLFKWSTKLEASIWKYLGWDNWSDFTPCSIACGKGVQQRFRRCLLDNPNNNNNHGYYSDGGDSSKDENDDSGLHIDTNVDYTDNSSTDDDIAPLQNLLTHQTIPNVQFNEKYHRNHHKKDVTFKNVKKRRKKKGKNILFRSQKLSTLSCEGYNIEQRDCNLFECTDDIIDLLKFYKKSFLFNDTTGNINSFSSSSSSLSFSPTSTLSEQANSDGISVSATLSSFMTTNGNGSSTTSNNESNNNNRGISNNNNGGGFVQRWENSFNFTIMMTLKAKFPSQSTIFSLRNLTSTLYVDQNHHGLKLYQERDDLSEMLPIKLNLYDNRWHQIAISVHNGDFISVYIDCMWLSSFVVSKHLLTLPNAADVEVGRGFNGDIQQLIIMSGIYDKQQCSSNKIPINEVKRYIIDTFIDDGGEEEQQRDQDVDEQEDNVKRRK